MVGFSRYYALLSGVVLTVGLVLTTGLARQVRDWEQTQRQASFIRQIDNLTLAIQRSLNRYSDILTFLNDYHQVNQTHRQDFAILTARVLKTYPGIQAMEWAPLVLAEDRPDFEAQVRSEGYESFQITELNPQRQLIRAGTRPYYTPVTYLEPWADNEIAFGYDLSSDLTRATAINQARDTGQITATGRIRLVQERRDQFGFLMFSPVYSPLPGDPSRLPTTLSERREQLRGFFLGVFRLSDLVEGSLQGLQYEIDFALYDRSAPPADQFLGQYLANWQRFSIQAPPTQRGTHDRLLCPQPEACTRRITVGQRQWAVVFTPSVNYGLEPRYGFTGILLVGVLLTGSLLLLLHTLQGQLRRTQALSDMKTRFFSMASHELRTPLGTILLSAESLQLSGDPLSPHQRQVIQRIQTTTKRLGQQLNDLLMLTRAEAGRLDLHRELFDLDPFCRDLVDEIALTYRRPLAFHSDCFACQAFLDRGLLRSLLTNLLINAIKYSPDQSPIQLRLSCAQGQATWQVEDQGQGIPAEDQPRIAEPFYRGGNVGDREGTGLGLAVVNTGVTLHGGDWQIHSQVGRGTLVTVRLPLE
ncbi:MAG: CHASE domain-containing protein [Cyanobacteriota bacterium]|nr:CHASE domain-containing protein [Cyanobacteriota bacterium]